MENDAAKSRTDMNNQRASQMNSALVDILSSVCSTHPHCAAPVINGTEGSKAKKLKHNAALAHLVVTVARNALTSSRKRARLSF